jgi:DNA-binding transcriptional regulator LsrR (DeoR family)
VRFRYVEQKTRGEIAHMLRLKGVSEVNRLDRFAREAGIITFTIDERAEYWQLHPGLSQQLRAKFDLHSAHVVTLPTDMQYTEEVDDEIHYQLGLAAARCLRRFIVDGTKLLTVGGRTTHYISVGMEMLSGSLDEPSTKPRGVQVVPVTGLIGAGMWRTGAPFGQLRVDADDAAFHLSRALGVSREDTHFLEYPGALSDPGEVAKALERLRELAYGPDGRHPPHIAICGVGRLGGEHALITALRQHRLGGHPLSPIVRILAGVVGTGPGISDLPYGDLANRLFPLFEQTPKDLDMLARANRCVVGLSMTELATVPMVLLCAGGEVKYPAIRRVLGFRRPGSDLGLIRVLVTDSKTAQTLLDEDDELFPKMDVADFPGERR